MNGYEEDLLNIEPEHSTMAGIDSDGCVFDTMEVKQKEHFHPLIIEVWNLQAIEPQLRRVAEFVNLYSAWRGSNRFIALLKVFELLRDWPEVVETGVDLPPTKSLKRYCESGLPLGNPSLEEEVERTRDPELERVLRWSLAINKDIDERMESIPPFEWARNAIEKISANSDIVVISQTPATALAKEWSLHDIDHYVQTIAGQEVGTKEEQLRMVLDKRYSAENTIMVGDAPGDMRAAEAVGAWFYPIYPGREEKSWQKFCEEDYERFLRGEFDPQYQQQLKDGYTASLPLTPPWIRA